MKKEYICIVCPNSCRITVDDEGGELKITGNSCKRGEEFARAEHTTPVRMFTSTVKLEGTELRRLPVISSSEVPKDKISECLAVVYKATAKAPVKCGDVIIENILGLGINIVASRSID